MWFAVVWFVAVVVAAAANLYATAAGPVAPSASKV